MCAVCIRMCISGKLTLIKIAALIKINDTTKEISSNSEWH
jgi:hypothetical protein